MALSMLTFEELRKQTQLLFLIPLACLGILYIAIKVLVIPDIGPHDHIDFQDIWLAAKIWVSGKSPYDGTLFPNAERLSTWFYPPYWYPLVVPFGLLPFSTALGIWKVINFSLLIGATYLIARVLADVAHKHFMPIFLAGTAFACFMHATPDAIWVGQTSVIVYFGLATLIFGLLKARPIFLIVGLLLLALKPQIGVIAFAAVLPLYRYRWTVIPPAVICLLATAAITITADFRVSVEGFLANLGRHADHASNSLTHLTGLLHILYYTLGISSGLLSTVLALFPAVLCTVVVFYISPINKKIRNTEDTPQTVASLALFVATIFFFIPLHNYDMVGLVALLMMIIAVSLRGRWLIALGLLICFRPEYLGRTLSKATLPEVNEAHFISLGLLLLWVGCVWALSATRSHTTLPARQKSGYRIS